MELDGAYSRLHSDQIRCNTEKGNSRRPVLANHRMSFDQVNLKGQIMLVSLAKNEKSSGQP